MFLSTDEMKKQKSGEIAVQAWELGERNILHYWQNFDDSADSEGYALVVYQGIEETHIFTNDAALYVSKDKKASKPNIVLPFVVSDAKTAEAILMTYSATAWKGWQDSQDRADNVSRSYSASRPVIRATQIHI